MATAAAVAGLYSDLLDGWLVDEADAEAVDQIDRLLNKESGLLGLSGKSNDVRELLELDDEAQHRTGRLVRRPHGRPGESALRCRQ